MVLIWSFGGWGHLWHPILYFESTMYVILELYANFLLPSMIKSASRSHLYLEDIDGS